MAKVLINKNKYIYIINIIYIYGREPKHEISGYAFMFSIVVPSLWIQAIIVRAMLKPLGSKFSITY
jgi:hypothetical protein